MTEQTTPEAGFIPQHCHSCAVPLNMPGMPMQSAAENFCRYCTDDAGAVKSREATRAQVMQWMRMWQPHDIAEAEMQARVDAYMRAMPHWASA